MNRYFVRNKIHTENQKMYFSQHVFLPFHEKYFNFKECRDLQNYETLGKCSTLRSILRFQFMHLNFK